ncbi:sulfatase atsG, partial [bacterium]|nr:sulfatase atsG [bacterium]
HDWNNLADSPEHVEIKKELRKQLDAWMKECGDLGQGTELAAYEHQGDKSKKNKGKAKGKAKE